MLICYWEWLFGVFGQNLTWYKFFFNWSFYNWFCQNEFLKNPFIFVDKKSRYQELSKIEYAMAMTRPIINNVFSDTFDYLKLLVQAMIFDWILVYRGETLVRPFSEYHFPEYTFSRIQFSECLFPEIDHFLKLHFTECQFPESQFLELYETSNFPNSFILNYFIPNSNIMNPDILNGHFTEFNIILYNFTS